MFYGTLKILLVQHWHYSTSIQSFVPLFIYPHNTGSVDKVRLTLLSPSLIFRSGFELVLANSTVNGENYFPILHAVLLDLCWSLKDSYAPLQYFKLVNILPTYILFRLFFLLRLVSFEILFLPVVYTSPLQVPLSSWRQICRKCHTKKNT